MLVVMSGMAEFGGLVKTARERRGWTQTELARRIGYDTHNLVVRIERGTLSNPPTPQTMRALERELGIPRRTMLEAMGYLDAEEEMNGDVITVRRDDPRADLLDLLKDASDDDVRTTSRIVTVISSNAPFNAKHGIESPSTPSEESEQKHSRTA